MTELNAQMVALGLPRRMRKFELDSRGYPVPWFVDRNICPIDIRVMDQHKRDEAVKHRKCWVCGETLGRFLTFVLGPMCAVSRITSEPACHRECATWSVKACPFLSHPQMNRSPRPFSRTPREVPGVMIKRNPGVIVLWTCRDFEIVNVSNGWLIHVGMP